ncbi:MAG: PP2C family serine/threonine-protein phosphatase [Capsulimonadales bacterium]|nr:PP2C family serine/threonine-protein phosphatase [Capsulimonadales bacterium]
MTTDMFTVERRMEDDPVRSDSVSPLTPVVVEDTLDDMSEDTLKEAPDDLRPSSGPVPVDSGNGAEGPAAVAVCSQTNGRSNNEDSYFVQTLPIGGDAPAVLLALSDGMGGHDFGEHASRETLRKLALLLFEQFAILPRLNGEGSVPTSEEIGRAMVSMMPLVSAHVQRIAEMNGWNRSGATLVAAVVVGDTAAVINVGDSPAYHVRPDGGMVVHLTEDHSLAGMLLKANLITAEMARVHEGRCQLEHYIGGPNLPNEMPVRTLTLVPGDYLVLCSDGVSNSFPEEAVLGNLLTSAGGAVADAATELVVHARRSGEHDNQTVIVYRHGLRPGTPLMTVIPDMGPVNPHPSDFPDNVPSPPLAEVRA